MKKDNVQVKRLRELADKDWNEWRDIDQDEWEKLQSENINAVRDKLWPTNEKPIVLPDGKEQCPLCLTIEPQWFGWYMTEDVHRYHCYVCGWDWLVFGEDYSCDDMSIPGLYEKLEKRWDKFYLKRK